MLSWGDQRAPQARWSGENVQGVEGNLQIIPDRVGAGEQGKVGFNQRQASAREELVLVFDAQKYSENKGKNLYPS